MHYIITIDYDNTVDESPWDWENVGFGFFSTHRDFKNINSPNYNISHEDFNGHDEAEDYFIKQDFIYVSLFLYSHSGWSVASTPFGDKGDSGQAGWFYMERKTAVAEWGNKRFTKAIGEKAKTYLEDFILSLNQYYTGDIYRYDITDENDEIINSSSSHYGKKYILEEIQYQKELLEHNDYTVTIKDNT